MYRTRTFITEKVLFAAKKLMVIGAFCSGTNNIDMGAVSALGVSIYFIFYNYYLYLNFFFL